MRAPLREPSRPSPQDLCVELCDTHTLVPDLPCERWSLRRAGHFLVPEQNSKVIFRLGRVSEADRVISLNEPCNVRIDRISLHSGKAVEHMFQMALQELSFGQPTV